MNTLSRNPIGDIAVDPVSGTLMSPDGADIYAVESDGIAVISASGGNVCDRIPFDARPSCVATSPATSRLYVADREGDVTALPIATPVLQAVAG